MVKVDMNETSKFVTAAIGGLMTIEEARQFKADLVKVAADARRRFGAFRLVADASEAPVQRQDVLGEMPAPHTFMTGPEDRWAVVVGSVLAKLQANRVLTHPQAQAFVTKGEAVSWATGKTV